MADDIRAAYQSVSAWTDHLEQYSDLQTRLGSITGTEGLDAWESWCTYVRSGESALVFTFLAF